MKTLKLLIIVLALFLAGTVKAQVAINVNAGTPPMWGPAGYSGVKYYYLPDVYSYYDVPSSMFIYQDGGKWVRKSHLPAHYRNYDLYSGYKVVMTDYHGNTPYVYYKQHKVKYAKGYKGPSQKNIGAKPGKGNIRQNVHSSMQPYKKSMQVKSNGQGNGNKQNGNGHGSGHGKNK